MFGLKCKGLSESIFFNIIIFLATYVEADDLPPPLPPPPPSFENEEPEIPHDPHAITSTPITVPLLCTTQDDEICPFKSKYLNS